MTRRLSPAFAATVVAAALASYATVAGAQQGPARRPPTTRRPPPPPADHTVTVPFRADSYSPQRGRTGTRVTIKGRGFTRSTQVLVGGREARVLSWSPSEIAFEVPAISRDAAIALRKPGRPSDLEVGLFRVAGVPVITRIAPVAGPPGERVQIFGRDFERGDAITMKGMPLVVSEWRPDRLVVTIPDGAVSDRFILTRRTGETARSQTFRVLMQPPAIARFSPEGGPPGTRVRITGLGFSPADRVSYGSIPTPVLGRGASWVDVEVPRKAPRSYHFQIRGPAGIGRSKTAFELDLPPLLTSFSPTRGAPGTQVDIKGNNFRSGDWASLAGKRLPIIDLTPKRIRVTIPIGSRTGRIAVGRDRHETASTGRFEVMYAPTLTAFTPTRGEPGTRVTINGAYLAGAQVHYGRQRIPVRSFNGDTELIVEIPRAARDDHFRVSTRAGSARSDQPFQVQYYTVIQDARPRIGAPGTTVVLRGRHLDKADDFFIGSTRMELVARDNSSATCRVPDGARSAPIAWMSFGRRAEMPWRFQVMAAPAIFQFQPTDGPVGTEIIIRGDHIERSTEAFFGRRKLRVVRVRPPHEIVVQLPRSAGGVDYLYLEGHGRRVRSERTFEIKVAPVVVSAEPSAARPGHQILVRGRWFTDATEILIGKQRSRVLRRDLKEGSILIEVPRDAASGPHKLSAKTEALVGEYRRPFVVLASASIDGVRPDRARWGQRVRVTGARLGRDVRIWFGSIELPIVKRAASGKEVWVVIPDTARGSAFLEIQDDGPRRRGAVQLTVEEPDTRIKVRDNRTRK